MLVITDNFMQYVHALITSSQTVKSTAQALWDRCIVHYGLPMSIVSDQGWNLESDLIAELCKLARVQNCILVLNTHKQMGSAYVSIIH